MIETGAAAFDRPEAERAAATRALVLGPYLRNQGHAGPDENPRSPDARIAEARGLAHAIGLDVVDANVVHLGRIRPSTYLGKGKVEEIARQIEANEIALVFVDCALSPVQQRNLERAFSAKVIDRSGLILEIFGRRAKTREGALQVELAHLAYQRSRLVRSWTHLERQRGGFGFLGGPGETQIETDRRLISERMVRIEAELDKVKRTRALNRKTRSDVPYPVVALVGYTNAGKSTLFNRLTRASVTAEDMLFATLDPTLRRIELPHGARAVLSDTVGFISDLPTMLVSAFRATLEEVVDADVILHVRDISHEDSDAQAADVEGILEELGVNPSDKRRIIDVWNKLDLLDEGRATALLNSAIRRGANDRAIAISALTGQGEGELLDEIEARLAEGHHVLDVDVDAADGQGLAWLYEKAEVLGRHDAEDGGVRLTVRVPPERAAQVRSRFGTEKPLLH